MGLSSGAAPFEIVFEGFAVTPAYVDRKLAPKHGSVRSHPKEANEFEPNHLLLIVTNHCCARTLQGKCAAAATRGL